METHLSATSARKVSIEIIVLGEIFLTVFLFAHGYASIIANNSLEYDEELIASHLEQTYKGAVLAAQEDI